MRNSSFFNRDPDNRNFLWIFLFFYFVFSFLTYRDYGITGDENDWYISGADMLKHYLHLGKEDGIKIFSIEQASHNYLYPAVLRIFSHSINPERLHLLNLLFASIGFAAAFELLLAAYRNPFKALAGPMALFLTLRFSGDIPANPKDMPFAVLYLLSLASIYLFRSRWKEPTWEALVVGSLIGLTTCVRAIGLTLLPLWGFYRFWQYRLEEKRPGLGSWISREWPNFLMVFVVSQFWMMACWPYLGENYFGNYLSIFKSSQRYTWEGAIMFMGQAVMSTQLPWIYLPVWLLVTLPVFLILFFLFAWFKLPKMEKTAMELFVLLGSAFFLQILLYLILRPVIYNGLRHYLFLVPIFCVMGSMGLLEFFKGGWKSPWKKAAASLCALNLLSILFQLASLYPFQYIYFNEFVGGLRGAAGKFETDYWGASLKEAAQWLSANGAPDPNRVYRVKTCSTREQQTHYFKPNLVGDNAMKDPDYQIEPNNPVMLERDHVSAGQIKSQAIFTVEREGVPLYYVLKLK
ncbi:MAG TPA: hypothetical protein VMV05_08770 [bacterium]|nr:hypothetical protein [bacterium]